MEKLLFKNLFCYRPKLNVRNGTNNIAEILVNLFWSETCGSEQGRLWAPA